ncbi:MAG TPA: 5-deoxy-glucuronate isomerase [Oscillatoriaceae cyanobacterium]
MNLLIKPQLPPGATGTVLDLTPQQAGWEYIGLKVVRLAAGETFKADNQGVECVIVFFAGTATVHSSAGRFEHVGGRENVFAGKPHAVYLPLGVHYTITAETPCEFGICTSVASEIHPAQLVTPDDVEIEIRGDGNATRQINKIVKPEFAAHRILIVEVFTPSGNWSSYPPHKHDVHDMPHEADLEEIYYFKVDKPEGYAIQKVYNDARTLDETLTVRDGELVLIPEGYHPVVAPPGYDVYYLNILAGSARSMAASDDPAYAWVRDTWQQRNPLRTP